MFDFLLNHTPAYAPAWQSETFEVCTADARGLQVRERGHETLRPWDEVLTLHAHALDPHSGEYKALVITFQDGRIALVSEAQANWGSLVQLVTERLPGVPPYPEWSRQLRVLPTEALRLY